MKLILKKIHDINYGNDCRFYLNVSPASSLLLYSSQFLICQKWFEWQKISATLI